MSVSSQCVKWVQKIPNVFTDSFFLTLFQNWTSSASLSFMRRNPCCCVVVVFFRNNSCVCYSRKCENSIKKLIPTSKSSPSPGYSLQLDALSALTERQIRESSRASRKQPSPARGSGASVSVCVSARSNSRIPYLEARGSRCCQESQVLPKWLPAKYFKIKSLMGGRGAATLCGRALDQSSTWRGAEYDFQVNYASHSCWNTIRINTFKLRIHSHLIWTKNLYPHIFIYYSMFHFFLPF